MASESKAELPNELPDSAIPTIKRFRTIPARTPERQFGVPRRFGIGTILLVTMATSLLLALLIARGAPASIILSAIGFLTLIGLGQAVLFHGKNPRLASIVTGAVLMPFCFLVAFAYYLFTNKIFHTDEVIDGCFFALGFAFFGALLGYLGGGLIGGLFLLMDRWEAKFGHRHAQAELFDPFAPATDASQSKTAEATAPESLSE